jgi:hypothetical protein
MKKLVVGALAAQVIALLFLVWPLWFQADPAELILIDDSAGRFVQLDSGNPALDAAFNESLLNRARELTADNAGYATDAHYRIIRADEAFIILEMTTRIIDALTLEPKSFIRDEFWLRFDPSRPDGGLVTRADGLEFLRWAGG